MNARSRRIEANGAGASEGRGLERSPRVLTWHVHGSYLYYLAQTPCEFILPVNAERSGRTSGRSGHFPWPDNVIEVPVEEIPDTEIDVVLFQCDENYLQDQYDVLSERQRRLPRIYLEHDPGLESPAGTRHIVDDRDVLLVHVTPFNALMWDCGSTPTRVIDHGVSVPEHLRYSGEVERGIVVVNNLGHRGRRLGPDVFEHAARRVPLDLAGMRSKELGGLGDLPRDELFELEATYRFFFHPIRYTSLGLALLEAMAIGLPIVGLATTELPTVIANGVHGYVDTDVDRLVAHMQELLRDPEHAAALGAAARERALDRFGIERFTHDWMQAFLDVVDRPRGFVAGGATVGSTPR